jgi:hypothetical protein
MKMVKPSLKELSERVKVAGEKARAEGWVDKNGTYTFNSKEASLLLLALSITIALMEGQLEVAIMLASVLRSKGAEAAETIDRLGQVITDTQAPPYIMAEVDRFAKELRQSNPNLS